jgi:hypothetical protein
MATKAKGPLQQWMDQRANEMTQAPAVNDFAMRQGDYEQSGEFGMARKRLVNHGGTPIARWKKAGLITEHQTAAINHCLRLWELTDTSARLVANLDRTVFGSPGDGNMAEIEARNDLQRIKGGFPFAYWAIFENVCRFDEPAGVAGSKLAEDDNTRRTMARTIVCMVADMIYMRERLSY